MSNVVRITYLTVLLVSLSACGFQMQGAFTSPPGMQRTYIASDDSLTPFMREFTARMKAAGVEVSDTASDATAIFTIHFDDTAQRVLSVSARNVPTEYEVFYTLNYSLDAGTEVLLPRQTLTLTRNYTYDPTLVLGKAREEELLRDAIVQDLVRIIMKQISTL